MHLMLLRNMLKKRTRDSQGVREIIKLPVRCEVKDTRKAKSGATTENRYDIEEEMRETAPLYTYFSDNSQIIITETSN